MSHGRRSAGTANKHTASIQYAVVLLSPNPCPHQYAATLQAGNGQGRSVSELSCRVCPCPLQLCGANSRRRPAPLEGAHLQAEHFLSCSAGLPQPSQRGITFSAFRASSKSARGAMAVLGEVSARCTVWLAPLRARTLLSAGTGQVLNSAYLHPG